MRAPRVGRVGKASVCSRSLRGAAAGRGLLPPAAESWRSPASSAPGRGKKAGKETGHILRVLAHDRLQLLQFRGARAAGIEAAHAIQIRLVGNVLVQRAACLLLAQQEREVCGRKGNGRLREIENIARFQSLAPGPRLLCRWCISRVLSSNRDQRHESNFLAS